MELTQRHRQERAKAAGTTARQVMTAQVATAYPEEPVAEAARRMYTRGVHRLPVVDRADVLAGIISRADVLKVFLRTDKEIRFELLDEIIAELLRLQGHPLAVEVEGGVVTLTGELQRRSQAVVLTELARRWTAWSPSAAISPSSTTISTALRRSTSSHLLTLPPRPTGTGPDLTGADGPPSGGTLVPGGRPAMHAR